MFNKLMELARQCDFTIGVRASSQDVDQLTLIVVPAPKEGQDAALAQPIRLTGTVEELAEHFAETMDRYIGARASLSEQLDATLAILEEAKANSVKKATDAIKGKGKAKGTPLASSGVVAPKSSPADAFDDDQDDESDGSDETRGAQAAASSATTSAPASTGSAVNLFG